ncbi:MAG: sulfonate ABC transporter substrate-binding protein [Candidatus Methanoperedens nitroreducens]|uniref:Sulfonate ABC transporter substrate-binding protein n=1 Tax=Candidatus Methanoperedens nitratireducens TaxID=1392998 RepID=A0A0P8CI52_9EURY|nr:ABC transporter substrate-binding protein [Candidatus Methanoperedens sp. BLZ2]KAB2946452.1 MAG: nitrate ABC transporter ATP-binding protein [Candidatus Methanoperedens sp.]KPQ42460.1 MAG: sulfonate ABC transporter substrate-binding protein [Candidatus Methanoperedens sp. BLZ1]MBZ0175689.1 ABC transporter substrate-binding protein [Candidatus Methanoperedens nitroreducens]WAH95041.1 MAG: ABC transporter substrate-binding protein [Candidatus Methanoperedens sp.]WAM22237.1 MAG: ABC transporte
MKNYIVLGAIVLVVASGLMFYEISGKTAMPNDQKSIFVVSMTADEMSKALVNNSIAGFISWEPNPSKAVSEGYGRYLVNSKDIWENHPSCVLAISEDLKDEDMIKALVWAEVKGTRFINNPVNREIVLEYGQEFSGINENMTSAVINNTVYIEYPDLNETKRAIDIMSKADVLKKNISSLGYTDVNDFLSKLYISKYYDEVRKKLDEDPNWIPPRVNGSLRFGYIEGNSHYFAIYIAQKRGYFEKVGLITGKNLQLTGYRSGRAITDALNHREVDAAIVGTSVLLRYKINDNGRIHIVNGVNSGGTSLVVRADSNITSVDDLNGQKIATPGFGTCQDTIMRKMFNGYEIKTQ